MAPSKKYPTNPNSPLYGEMDELDIPSELLKSTHTLNSYDSECLRLPENLSYVEDVFEQLKKYTKFNSKREFMSKLDAALLEFQISRGCVIAGDSGDLNDQKEYFSKLEKAVNKLNSLLGQMHENHSRRLAYAGFVLPQFFTGEGMENDFLQETRNLESAVKNVREELRDTNSGRNAEFHLLIEELIVMYKACTGEEPKITNEAYPDKPRGPCFDLIKAIYPLANLPNNQSITDNSIIDGIKLVRKS